MNFQVHTGQAEIYLEGALITKVQYRLSEKTTVQGIKEIKGTITILDDFMGFFDSDTHYEFVTPTFQRFKFLG